jgi:hypothetical protein
LRIEPAGTPPPGAVWPVSVPEDEFYEVTANWRSDSSYVVADANKLAPSTRNNADALFNYGQGCRFELAFHSWLDWRAWWRLGCRIM